ncbi:hypothetical protein ACFL52_01640 [Candidatus Margulisiibacteriota bacterium]
MNIRSVGMKPPKMSLSTIKGALDVNNLKIAYSIDIRVCDDVGYNIHFKLNKFEADQLYRTNIWARAALPEEHTVFASSLDPVGLEDWAYNRLSEQLLKRLMDQ